MILILVLVEKLEISLVWLKWLFVILLVFVFVIVSFLILIFFEEIWLFFKKVVENLEVEKEKFFLVVIIGYRIFCNVEEKECYKMIRDVMVKFINMMSNIYFKKI